MAKQQDRAQRTTADRFSPADVLRRVQEFSVQLAGAARSMSDASTTGQPVPLPMARWGEQAIELSTLWVAPMRAVLEEQQELIEAISAWAEEQRKLADRFADLAARHRAMTEGVAGMLTPTLDHLDQLAGRKPSATKGKQGTSSSGRG